MAPLLTVSSLIYGETLQAVQLDPWIVRRIAPSPARIFVLLSWWLDEKQQRIALFIETFSRSKTKTTIKSSILGAIGLPEPLIFGGRTGVTFLYLAQNQIYPEHISTVSSIHFATAVVQIVSYLQHWPSPHCTAGSKDHNWHIFESLLSGLTRWKSVCRRPHTARCTPHTARCSLQTVGGIF